MLRTKFGNNNIVADPGTFFNGREGVGSTIIFGFRRGWGGFHSPNALFLPYFVKFSDEIVPLNPSMYTIYNIHIIGLNLYKDTHIYFFFIPSESYLV